MSLRGSAGHAFFASFLGWTLDAFDFFVLVFVLPAVAEEFHRSVPDIASSASPMLAHLRLDGRSGPSLAS